MRPTFGSAGACVDWREVHLGGRFFQRRSVAAHIAKDVIDAPSAIETHVNHIQGKLVASCRTEAATKAIKRGIVPSESQRPAPRSRFSTRKHYI